MDETRTPTVEPETARAAGQAPSDFIRERVAADVAAGRYPRVVTRFPPEPNGYLHIGHAKSIVLNFGIAREQGGVCHLRFDDSNPLTEDMEYVEAIQRDVRWLGYDWGEHLHFASDYFERLYELAVELIRRGKAYVDSLPEEEIRRLRGTVTEAGEASPYRDRPVEENLELFAAMRAGEFPDGAAVLRARIDMASPNMKMRDPLLYRIRHAEHYRRRSEWCLYPMYDYIHGLSDAFEGVSHSLCTLEFENNRELYDWILEALEIPHPRPQQIEFARLELNYTLMSKRKLLELVDSGVVEGWDDPRMPTLAGLRHRGVPPAAIRAFCERIGVSKAQSTVDVALLEHTMREELNQTAPRVLGVLRPLEVVIENYPEGTMEELEAPFWPHDIPKEGSRKVPFSRRLYIERDDFMKEPPPGYHRLAPGREVRLRYGYLIRCQRVVEDPDTGEVVGLQCTYDPETRGGSAPDGRKVAGTLHWVSADHALDAEARLYDRLFLDEQPDRAGGGAELRELLNPESLEVLQGCKVEPWVRQAEAGSRLQLERLGYFYLVPEAAAAGNLVLHRIVTLRDTWGKRVQREEGERERGEGEGREAPRKPQPEAAEVSAALPRDPLEGLPVDERQAVERFGEEHGLGLEEARLLGLDPDLRTFFEEAVATGGSAQGVANWMVNELLREVKKRRLEALPFSGGAVGELVALVEQGTVSSAGAKEVFAEMLEAGGAPRDVVARRGLEQVSDRSALEPVVERVLAAEAAQAELYRQGKKGLLGYFVGRVMKETSGRADPRLVNELLSEKLGA
jgi:glutaminyl-tRNA synthetase